MRLYRYSYSEDVITGSWSAEEQANGAVPVGPMFYSLHSEAGVLVWHDGAGSDLRWFAEVWAENEKVALLACFMIVDSMQSA
jgi:hypothetical protein